MAFKLVAECTMCGVQITVANLEELEDAHCEECYGPRVQSIPEPEYISMSKAERQERYRLQYKANGYSWLGKEPTMWQGELE